MTFPVQKSLYSHKEDAMKFENDEQIKHKVERELHLDNQVKHSEVGVNVSAAVVTLTGTLNCYAKKLAAQEAAQRVPNVSYVANEIHVKIAGSGFCEDAEINKAIISKLECEGQLRSKEIQATVSEGWVTLSGEVNYLSERDEIARAVLNVRGVIGIHNRLTAKESKIIAEEVRALVQAAH
jgi:osmotically-inducible protein OsmY